MSAAPARVSLWTIGEQIDAVFQAVESGVDPEGAMELYLSDLLERRDEKIDAYCGLYRQFLSEAAVCQAEADRLLKRAQTRTAAAERLKTRLHTFLQQQQIDVLRTDTNTVRRQGNGGNQPVLIDSAVKPKDLPAEFQNVTISPNAAALLKALLAGFEIEGVSLGERGEHLRID